MIHIGAPVGFFANDIPNLHTQGVWVVGFLLVLICDMSIFFARILNNFVNLHPSLVQKETCSQIVMLN